MAKYILKRLAIAVATVLVLTTIIFVLVHMLPGDPFASDKTSEAVQAKMNAYYGLDKPLFEQWFTYMKNMLHGDFGMSLKYAGRSVNDAIAQTFPYSAGLGVRSILVALFFGLILGTVAAHNAGKPIDYLCVIIAIIGVSMPDFIIGTLLQLAFAIKLKWFPAGQWLGPMYYVLPVIALSLYTLSLITRLMRSSMLDVTNQDYVLTAKAKGLSQREIIVKHQLRNAILPIVTTLGPLTAAILTGTFVLEKIFAIPGMGKFYVQSINDLDYTMVLGMTAFYGIFLVIANLVVDILYVVIDPRIKLAQGEK